MLTPRRRALCLRVTGGFNGIYRTLREEKGNGSPASARQSQCEKDKTQVKMESNGDTFVFFRRYVLVMVVVQNY